MVSEAILCIKNGKDLFEHTQAINIVIWLTVQVLISVAFVYCCVSWQVSIKISISKRYITIIFIYIYLYLYNEGLYSFFFPATHPPPPPRLLVIVIFIYICYYEIFKRFTNQYNITNALRKSTDWILSKYAKGKCK